MATCDIRPGRRPRGAARMELVTSVPAPGRARRPKTPQAARDMTDGIRRATRCTARWPMSRAMRATRTVTRSGSASSPTPASASAARPARWPARNGTGCPTRDADVLDADRHVLRQHRRARREQLAARGVHRADARSIREIADDGTADAAWLMASDVCKHCTHAACLDVCPTGALVRTEFGTVIVQPDVCNGCAYCVSACPFGVIDRREDDGRAWKCTMCYDRLRGGLEPACAKACPTDSIQFGPLDELRDIAQARLADVHAAGHPEARLYGADPDDGIGGAGAFFLLLDEPEVYGLPPGPGSHHQGPARDVALGRSGRGRAAAGSWRSRAAFAGAPVTGCTRWRPRVDRAAAGTACRLPVLLRPADPQGHAGGRSRTCRPTCSWASCPARWLWSAPPRSDRAPRRWPGRRGSVAAAARSAAARS